MNAHLTATKIFLCILFFLMGQLLHLFWIKIPALRKDAKLANVPFSLKKYWENDWNIVAGMQIVGAVFTIGLGSILKLKPELADYIQWIFFGAAFMGSSYIMSRFSKFGKIVDAAVDYKTDVADGIKDKTNDVG